MSRYTVTHHADKKGPWYTVIDQQVNRLNLGGNNVVWAGRNRKVAHKRASEYNAGTAPPLYESAAQNREESLSGSEWFHAGMPS